MDLAQSILQELITLQKKNEELARIIGKLEHESDIIIQQFEHKIEELQKDLKHEQDEKSRSARRYEAEIRDLEETKSALIQETAQVRETFGTQIKNLEEQIAAATRSLEEKKQEFILLQQSSELEISSLREAIHKIRDEQEKRDGLHKSEISELSRQVRDLTGKLTEEESRSASLIREKEGELKRTADSLHTITLRLYEAEEHGKIQAEQSRITIEHLNHIIHSERQIRNRELKERDKRIQAAGEDVRQAEERLADQKRRYDADTERLNKVIDEALLAKAKVENENHQLSENLASLSREFDTRVQKLSRQNAGELDSLREKVESLNIFLSESEEKYRGEIARRDDELAAAMRQLDVQERSFRKDLENRDRQIAELQSEIQKVREVFQKTAEENKILLESLRNSENRIVMLQDEHIRSVEELSRRLDEAGVSHQEELRVYHDTLQQVIGERDQAVTEKSERELFFRREIAGLHEELTGLHHHLKAREEELIGEVSLRDTQISEISSNNEALRTDIDRIRLQYRKLQDTIRAEKDESVHALYREITRLEDLLSGRDGEIADLTKRVLRLDAENTRLLQDLSRSAAPIPVESRSEPAKKEQETGEQTPASLIDPRQKEILDLAAELEDPDRAPEAAKKLADMGNQIVEVLIPLLHSGSIQRRVWIAVVLYEINDNRATLPLMKLLETPKVHFRELIWEAKNQYRSYHRSGTVSAGNGGVRPGSPWPGL